MTKYVFLPVPGYGHVNPTLPVARELVERGQQVSYYLPEEFRPAIEATGAAFHSYQSLFNTVITMPVKASTMLAQFTVRESTFVLPQVIERIRAEQPDCILYEWMSEWGGIVVRNLDVPAIMLHPILAHSTQFIKGRIFTEASAYVQDSGFVPFFEGINEQFAELCHNYDVAPFSILDLVESGTTLNLVFLPKEFQLEHESLGQRFVFVGPAIETRPDAPEFPVAQLEGKKNLYISLGTLFNNQAPFFNLCFAAFKDTPWQVVISLGPQVDPAELDPIPDNFLARPYVPQLEVLSHSSLFISHCGMNSVMESLYYGVPLIGIPQMMEQQMTASHIQELGLGIILDRHTITPHKLRAAVEQVMGDPTYLRRVQRMQQHTRNAGGYRYATDVIIDYAQTYQ